MHIFTYIISHFHISTFPHIRVVDVRLKKFKIFFVYMRIIAYLCSPRIGHIVLPASLLIKRNTTNLHRMTKFIFVTGGVASSLGKGILAASLGKLLQARGFKVTNQKMDPYVNVDSGTLNPYEHGECYVTVDGHECDLDLGHYERFLNVQLHKCNNITTGRIYRNVIERERRGDFLGKTVQVIPHITDEIKRNVKAIAASDNYDFVITEIGGTVGDIESLPYIESVRQLKWELGNDCLCIHLTYVPFLAAAHELKTKPTQHSVKALQQEGVQPDIIILRTEHEISQEMKRKVALFCNVDADSVMQSVDASTIYRVPLNMQAEKLDEVVLRKTGFDPNNVPQADMKDWNNFLHKLESATEEVHITLVGKYVQLQDAYKSIRESLTHAAAYNHRKLILNTVLSDTLTEENVKEQLSGQNGIVVCPGFGNRGVEGKLVALRYARENNIPCLGICMVSHIPEPTGRNWCMWIPWRISGRSFPGSNVSFHKSLLPLLAQSVQIGP